MKTSYKLAAVGIIASYLVVALLNTPVGLLQSGCDSKLRFTTLMVHNNPIDKFADNKKPFVPVMKLLASAKMKTCKFK